jgi:hypothetical protein
MLAFTNDNTICDSEGNALCGIFRRRLLIYGGAGAPASIDNNPVCSKIEEKSAKAQPIFTELKRYSADI